MFFTLLFVLIEYSCALFAQKYDLDSLRKIMRENKADTHTVRSLILLSREMRRKGKTDSFTFIVGRSLELSQKINFKKGAADAYNELGIFSWNTGNYEEAVKHHTSSLKIREELKDDKGIARSLGNIGLVYYTQSEYPKALDYYFKALKINETLKDNKAIALRLGNIALVYAEQNEFTKALEYYFRSLNLSEKVGDKNSVAHTYNNIANLYKRMRNLNKSVEYYTKALRYAEEMGYKPLLTNVQTNMGSVYYHYGCNATSKATADSFFTLARTFDLKGLKTAEEVKDKKGVASAASTLATLLMRQEQYKEAEKYLKLSLELSNEMQIIEYIGTLHLSYAKLDSASGNFEGAFEHYKKYIAARDSIDNNEKTKKQTQVEMQYEFDKKETQAKAQQEKRDAVTKIIIYSISAGLLLVFILAIFIFASYRRKRTANIIIAQQKAEVEKQRDIVEEKQKEILDSIHYAQRIQRALITSELYIERALKAMKGNT